MDLKMHLLRPGGPLTAELARQGLAPEALAPLLGRLPPVEVYFPVAAHRARWAGDTDLIVVAALDENRDPVGYDVSGNRLELSLEEPPTIPALVLTRSETDFASSKALARPVGPAGVTEPCPPDAETCDGDGDGGGTGIPCGVSGAPGSIYVLCLQLFDLHEPWIRGNPEIEIHTFLSTPGLPFVSCAGEYASGDRYFDQNSSVWAGAVRVSPSAGAQEYRLLVTEDDDGSPCTGDTSGLSAPTSTGELLAAYGIAGLLYVNPYEDTKGFAWTVATLTTFNWVLNPGDDTIGRLVSDPAPNGWNSQVYDGSSVSGWANMRGF